jgi:predicted dehydrogenase
MRENCEMNNANDQATNCRWGFLSTAVVGRKNWLAVKNSGNGQVVAVASRDIAKCQSFIDECQAAEPFAETPRPIGSYEELLTQDDIDAVYIPLPTGLRKEWVIRAAQAGKHVMCEKPCGNHVDDLKEMIAVCQANNVQFMDGVMYMHTDRMKKMRELLDDGTSVGEIRRIISQFSFNGGAEFEQTNIRTNSNLEPLGCLGDLGWYTIRFSLWAMNYELPKTVTGRMLRGHQRPDSPQPVPMEFEGELFFENGVTAMFYNSFVTEHQQWANVSGTRGHLYLPDFVLPYHGQKLKCFVTNAEFAVNGCHSTMTENRSEFEFDEYGDSHPDAQESKLFRRFGKIVTSGKLDPFWPEISMKTQQVMDAVMQSASNDSTPVAL